MRLSQVPKGELERYVATAASRIMQHQGHRIYTKTTRRSLASGSGAAATAAAGTSSFRSDASGRSSTSSSAAPLHAAAPGAPSGNGRRSVDGPKSATHSSGAWSAFEATEQDDGVPVEELDGVGGLDTPRAGSASRGAGPRSRQLSEELEVHMGVYRALRDAVRAIEKWQLGEYR